MCASSIVNLRHLCRRMILHRAYKSDEVLRHRRRRRPRRRLWLGWGHERLRTWTTYNHLGRVAIKRADIQRKFGARRGSRGIQKHVMI